jgi:hypothetical protein
LPRVSTRGLRLPVLLSTIYSLGRPPAAAGIHSLGSGPRHSSFFILHSSFFILHFSPSQISDPPGRGASVLRAPSIQSQLRMTATCSLQPDTCSLFSQPQRGCGCQPKVATARPGLPWEIPDPGTSTPTGLCQFQRRSTRGPPAPHHLKSQIRPAEGRRPQGARWLPRVSTRGAKSPPPTHLARRAHDGCQGIHSLVQKPPFYFPLSTLPSPGRKPSRKPFRRTGSTTATSAYTPPGFHLYGPRLLELARYPEAEWRLLRAHEVLAADPQARSRDEQVKADLAALYQAWGKPESAAQWQPGQ